MSLKDLVKRSGKVAFIESTKGDSFLRMKGFTDLATNREANEYSRQYVDEDSERTDVTGVSVSMDFNFDQFKGNAAQEVLIDIIENEKIGGEAIVNIVQVDFTKESGSGFEAVKRAFSVTPGASGDTIEAYTYSGTLNASGEKIKGVATSTDGFKTSCTFEEGSTEL